MLFGIDNLLTMWDDRLDVSWLLGTLQFISNVDSYKWLTAGRALSALDVDQTERPKSHWAHHPCTLRQQSQIQCLEY